MEKKATKDETPRSRRLFEAGFTKEADAAACSKAVAADLASGAIGATEANQMTNAIGQWSRAHGRRGGK
jgi:hypothetical protein